MLKRKINKETVIIAVLLIFTMIISVFAITNTILANKTAANSNIAPYTYKMVLAYFEYWKDGDTYLADVPNESGKVVRKNIGAEPDQHIEWDYWFPVATLPGNYKIEDIMNYKDYKGLWDDLNYTGGIPQKEVEKYYMKTAVIHNKEPLIGASNTTVKFQATFKPLPPDKAKKEGVVYRCYIAIVIKYKNLDYVENFDGYEVKYEEIGTNKEVKGQKPLKNFEAERAVTEYPASVNGYKYNGNYKIEKTDSSGNVTTIKGEYGESATVNLAKTSSIYTITFYYLKDSGGGTDPDPGLNNVMVYVWHKEKGTDKDLADLQKVWTSMGSNLVVSSISRDGYKCNSSSIKGLTTKNYEDSYINEVVGRYDYSTPDDGYIYVTFYYEKAPKPPDYRCDPWFDADAEGARITMKRSAFEKAQDLYFEGVHAEINGTKFGYKDGEKMPGEHEFSSMDVYFRYGDSGYDFQRNGVYSKQLDTSLSVPQKNFMPENPEKTVYRMPLGVHIGVWCICDGFEVDKTGTSLYVDIIENKPPHADYEYSTVKTLPSGQKSRVYNRAYIGKDVVIDNYCTDPNGTKDIDYVIYTFKNSSGQVKNLKFKMQPWIEYKQESADDFSDTSIIYNGADNGNLNVIFTTDEEWEVSIYVQDLDGASDTYTNTIKPEELSLKPTAVIKDAREYRYPAGQIFSGKQNRVIKLDSNDSYVASWLDDMDVTINHSNDVWKIEPLDGQDINSAKFEKDLNKIISGNILNVRYEPLDLKMMFKEPGRYKINLRVTDTEGNVSDWTEQIITIHEDLPPTVTANINPKYYRNGTGNATITVKNINVQSTDYDNAEIEKIEYRYDSNNDGNFGSWVNLSGGSLYTSNLGRYQFKVTVKESFGQETIQKYITDSDYKRGTVVLYTEIDNIAPNVTKFKVMRTE